ncbi:hypothetical protein RB653_008428 [Dictyostelium firmibasis]|uniref:Uncharacterized protein n=1 Tax=Dictyostelium firmibasis TaxID=79012 RepID=A0AAN7U0B3_9MYCE
MDTFLIHHYFIGIINTRSSSTLNITNNKVSWQVHFFSCAACPSAVGSSFADSFGGTGFSGASAGFPGASSAWSAF